MIFSRNTFLSLLLSCVVIVSSAQTTIMHRQEIISSLDIDEEGFLVVSDARNTFAVKGHHLIQHQESPLVSMDAEYEIENGQLKKNIGKNFSFLPLPFTPIAVAKLETQLLCSSAADLWTIKDGTAKKIYLPGQKFPENITAIKGQNGLVAVLTREQTLHVYDTNTQIISFVDEKVAAFAFDKWDCLWYSSGSALKQNVQFINNQPPILKVERITNGLAEVLTDPITLNDEFNSLMIYYKGVYPPSFDALEYSYSLDGSPWAKCGPDMMFLRAMNAGRHEVRVRAETPGGLVAVSELIRVKVASEKFSLLWPLLFGGLALMGFMMWLSQQRLQKSLDALAVEKDRINMELQLVNEKQKLGQLQMNPHFIFNTLNSISGLIALNENKLARTQLNKFSQMMRSVLSSSAKEYISLTDELKFLEDYLSLEQLIRADKFDFSIESDITEACMVPPMILQPFLENAIVHGLNTKQSKGTLKLQLSDKEKYIVATIEDNGIGRAASAFMSDEGHESMALEIIEERLKALNKWNDVGLLYEDLIDGEGQPAGTRVTLHLPKQILE